MSARTGRRITAPTVPVREAFTTSQRIEYYDGQGSGMGNLVELASYEWEYPNDDPRASTSDFLIVTGNAEGVQLGISEAPWIFFQTALLMRFYTDVGGGRGYYVWRVESGRVTPYLLNLVDAIKTGATLVGEGMAAVVTNLVSVVTAATGGVGAFYLENQPVPMHHIGALKVTNRVWGTTREGGTDTGNRTTFASSDVTTETIVMTEAFADWMRGKELWAQFLRLDRERRLEDIRIVSRWERARAILAANPDIRSPMDPRMEGLPRPDNPPSTHPWCWWAWKRHQALDAPPSDPRRMNYPGYTVRNMTP